MNETKVNPEKERQVPTQIYNLISNIEGLESVVKEITRVIDSITLPEDMLEDKDSDRPEMVPVAYEIFLCNNRVVKVNEKLLNLMNRIEL